MQQFLLLPLLLVAPFLITQRADAKTSDTSITTVSHGMKLTLVVSRQSFPRNALVQVGVRLENVSREDLRVATYPRLCGYGNPGIDVTDARGRTVFPPATTFLYQAPICSTPSLATLAPGDVRTGRPLVILRGRYIQVVAQIELEGETYSVFGRKLLIHLYAAPPLNATLKFDSDGFPYAVIGPVPHPHSSLRYVSSNKCLVNEPDGQITTYAQWNIWLEALSSDVPAACPNLLEWHMVAGYLDHPVATLDYVRKLVVPQFSALLGGKSAASLFGPTRR
jgi:hypothetical protein